MSYLLHVFILVCIYVTLAEALNFAVGFGGLLSLAQGAFFGIGAYVTAIFLVDLKVSFPVALIGAVCCTTAVAIAAAVPAIRFRGDFFVLVTLGFQMIAFTIMHNWTSLTRGPYGISGIPKPGWGEHVLRTPASLLALSAGLMLIVLVLLTWISRTPFGRTLQAVRDDELAASSLGKNPAVYKLTAFALSGSLASLAGGVYASYTSYIDPTSFTLSESIFILAMVIVGGTGNLKGPLLGAGLLIFIPEVLRLLQISTTTTANLQQIIYGAAIILMMRFRPQGLWGRYALD